MKKILAVLLVLAMTFVFFGCGAEKDSSGSSDSKKDNEVKTTVCSHEWAEADCTTPKTCTACGATEGEASGHTWKDADCENPKTCEACSVTDGEAMGHTWAEADCTTPKTCTVCGATDGEANGHKYSSGVCSVCNTQDPKRVGLKEALEDCERYVTYLSIDAEIIETQIDLYRTTRDTRHLLDIQETALEMYDYFSRIEKICEPYSDTYLGLMYDCCDVDYPVITSSSLSDASALARAAVNMEIFYNSARKTWG